MLLFDVALKREIVRQDKKPENFIEEQEAYGKVFDYEPSKFDDLDAKPSLKTNIQNLSYLDEDTTVFLQSFQKLVNQKIGTAKGLST